MYKTLYDNKAECCGCEACINSCPVSIIDIKADQEGFYYPYIREPEKCISCKKCERVCPIKNATEVDGFEEQAFAGYLTNKEELRSCSSGGLATAISEAFIRNNNGMVYGVVYSEDYEEAYYTCVDSVSDLDPLKTSKYAQARKYNVYNSILEKLKDGKKILFIGLPCDAYALQRFCGQHNNLYVCTLVCHGVTSPSVLTQYLSSKRGEGERITGFSLRYKQDGWKPYYIFTEFNNSRQIVERFDKSDFGNAFIFLKRPSCNSCNIKRSRIHSDVTIGDYHNVGANDTIYNMLGVSSAIVHNPKGNELLQQLDRFSLEEVDLNKVIKNQGYLKATVEKKNRKEYSKVFSEQGLMYAAKLKSCKRIEEYDNLRKTVLHMAVVLRRVFRRVTRRGL